MINEPLKEGKKKNHSTQDSRVVPHRGTNWAAPWLTSQIGRDAVLSRSYGRGYVPLFSVDYKPHIWDPRVGFSNNRSIALCHQYALRVHHSFVHSVLISTDWNDIDMGLVSHWTATE